jgi:hypothetical protein
MNIYVTSCRCQYKFLILRLPHTKRVTCLKYYILLSLHILCFQLANFILFSTAVLNYTLIFTYLNTNLHTIYSTKHNKITIYTRRNSTLRMGNVHHALEARTSKPSLATSKFRGDYLFEPTLISVIN